VGEHPIRPGQPVCPFYDRTGSCKFGSACKFHHSPTPACLSIPPPGTPQQQLGSSTPSETATTTTITSLPSSIN